MNILKYVILCFTLILSITASSQSTEWVKKMMSGEHTFEEIQDQFNHDWKNYEYARGHGWKQYKRWEHFWSTRLMPDGSFPHYSKGFESYNKFIEKNNDRMNQNGDWTPLGPTDYTVTDSWSPGLGRVNFIVEDPNNSNIIYIGTPGGGAWKSVDSGSSWTPLSDDLAAIGVSSIGIAKTNSQIIYMATGDADGGDTPSIGVAKSIDAGATWTIISDNSSIPGQLADVLVDPTDENIVYVASRNDGVYKTTDGGNSWTQSIAGTYRDIEFKPGNSQVIYAAGESDVQVSSNGGASWTEAAGIPSNMTRIALGVTPADDNIIYALIADEDGLFKGIYVSNNGGTSFSPRNTTTDCFEGDQSWFDMAISVSPINKDLIFTGVLNVWKSTDGGNSLVQVNSWFDHTSPSYTHADIHFLRYYNGNLYCGSDGGIYKSTDNGNEFTDLSDGLQIGQFYRISGIENNVNTIAGGLQDNGNYLRSNANWKVWIGADGMENAVNPNNPMEAYGMIQNGALYKTEDGGQTNEDVSDSDLEGNWVTPMSYDQTGNRIVAGYDNIYQFNGTWTALSTHNFDDNLSCLEIAPSDNQTIYVASESSVYKTVNNGSTILDITNNLSNINTDDNPITSIEVHNTDPSKVWVTIGGWSNGVKVAHSTDGGASWSNITGSLPNLPCNIVKIDGTSEDTDAIYVGMDVGVYYRNAALTDFVPFMTKLPKVKVLDIEINESNDKIRLGTYGRGVWESPTYTLSTLSDNDNDGYTDDTDCDDNNPAINPGATEICNGLDDNCDGMIDEGLATMNYFQDADNDGYGNPDVLITSCQQPTGYIINNMDCDDTNSSINPGATEMCNDIDDNCDGMIDEGVATTNYFQDADNDGFGNPDEILTGCVQPMGYILNNTDCDDTDASINPDATDIPNNGIDEDCDGEDENNLVDSDNDGYTNDVDCDDNNPSINPGATEICNGIDDNCDGDIDENIAVMDYFQDADDDGYGNPDVMISDCMQPLGYILDNTDCDDMDASINPDATDIPDNDIDENCDGQDETELVDNDNDGYTNDIDCDDDDPEINPDATEICNDIDDNCDGSIDEGLDYFEYFEDFDNDGYGNEDFVIEACEMIDGYVDNADDCDDSDAGINPDADDIPNNGIDEDCDGQDASSSTHELSSSTINIFPNPTVNYLYIDVTGDLDYKLDLFTAAGHNILTLKNRSEIRIQDLNEGVFFLKITDLVSNHYIIEKIIVLRK